VCGKESKHSFKAEEYPYASDQDIVNTTFTSSNNNPLRARREEPMLH